MVDRIVTHWRMIFSVLILVTLAVFALSKGVSVLAGDRGTAAGQARQTVAPQATFEAAALTTQGTPLAAGAALEAAPPTPLPPGGKSYHTVQTGETLGKIAATYGVTTAVLVQANGISNPDLIRVGQRLVIPAR